MDMKSQNVPKDIQQAIAEKTIKNFIASLVSESNYRIQRGMSKTAVNVEIELGILEEYVIDGISFLKR
jgi:hypothetical protein